MSSGSSPVPSLKLPRVAGLLSAAGVAAGSLMPSGSARAQAAGSLHYGLEPVAVDAGGLTATGSRYTLNTSVMAGGAGFSGTYASLTGYAGQLREPVAAVPVPAGIALRASPLTIPEDGTRQIGADLLFTDGSWSPLPAAMVTWTVASGPVSSVSTGGLAAGSPVYRDSLAIVRGQYLTYSAWLPVTVLDTLPDNYGSYGGDGLPDAWQVDYFGLNHPNAAPRMDPDGDGYDNRFEFDACLDPADRFSTFYFLLAGNSDGRHVSFYPVLDGCHYTVSGSSDLVNWAPVSGPVSVSGSLRSIFDPTPNQPRRFYQIHVRRE